MKMETYQHRIEPKQVMSNTADSFLLYTACTVLTVSYRNKSCPLGSFFYPDCTDLGYIVSTISFCAVRHNSKSILRYKCKTATYPLSGPIKVLN
jgi:hypothetical protein